MEYGHRMPVMSTLMANSTDDRKMRSTNCASDNNTEPKGKA